MPAPVITPAVTGTAPNQTIDLGNYTSQVNAGVSRAWASGQLQPDVATGRAAVADGDEFQVLVGNEYVRYRRDSSTTQTEVGRYPTGAFVAQINSAVAPGGGVEIGRQGAVSTGPLTNLQAANYAIGTPLPKGRLRRMVFTATSAGTMNIFILSLAGPFAAGTAVTVLQQFAINAVVGLNTFEVSDFPLVTLAGGEYIGFTGTRLGRTGASAYPTAVWAATISSVTNLGVEAQFVVERDVLALSALGRSIGDVGTTLATLPKLSSLDWFRAEDYGYTDRMRQRERTIRAQAEARLVLSSATIHCAPGATGTGDGTSWANAFTTMNAAFNAAPDGATILTDAPQSAPFPTQAVNLSAAKRRLRIITNAGPSGVTWVDARKRLTWADDTGGVWSAALATKPAAVSYNIRQDDVAGTVTGCDLTKADVAEAIAIAGRKPSDLVAWYGFMREVGATTAPAEGEWSYSGGRVYINPPGSPVQADVNALAAYNELVQGVAIAGQRLEDSYIYGDLRTFHTTTQDGGTGYGVRLLNERRCTVADHTAYLCGYHATGITNDGELRGSALVNCTTVGQASNVATNSGVYPYVLYSTGGTVGDADLVGQSLLAILFPQLDGAGAPILAAGGGFRYSPAIGFSHTAGGAALLAGVEWNNVFQIDFLDELEKKHAVAINYAPGAPNGSDVGAVLSIYSPQVKAVRVNDGYFIGGGAAPRPHAQYTDCVFSRSGRGKTGQLVVLMSDGAGVKAFHVRGGRLNSGRCGTYFASSRLTDEISFNGVDIVLEETPAFKQGDAAAFVTGASTFQSLNATNAILQTGPALFTDNPYAGFVSRGGNIFGPNLLAEKHPSYPSIAARTMLDLVTAKDPKGRDVIGVDLS